MSEHDYAEAILLITKRSSLYWLGIYEKCAAHNSPWFFEVDLIALVGQSCKFFFRPFEDF